MYTLQCRNRPLEIDIKVIYFESFGFLRKSHAVSKISARLLPRFTQKLLGL